MRTLLACLLVGAVLVGLAHTQSSEEVVEQQYREEELFGEQEEYQDDEQYQEEEQYQQEPQPIDWEHVTPVWQSPAFFDHFPILRWIITRNPDRRNGFILGGFPAKEQQFPWNVALLFSLPDTNAFCGGTLITPEWVLTAAHCAQMSNSGVAIAGSVNIMSTTNDNQQRVTFNETVISHIWDPSSFANDLALVRLDSALTLNEYVQPARLPSVRHMDSTFTNQRATVAGWGSITPWVSPFMRFIRSQVMGRLSCRISYPGLVHRNNICTGGAIGQSPCQGDSGVAITVQEIDSNQTVIGVLSFGSGLGCGSNRPAVYTLVGPYLPWIHTVTDVPLRN